MDGYHVGGRGARGGGFEGGGFVGGVVWRMEDGFAVVGGGGIWGWGGGGFRGGGTVEAGPEGVDVDGGGFGAACGLLFGVSV